MYKRQLYHCIQTLWGCFFNDLPLDYSITVHRYYIIRVLLQRSSPWLLYHCTQTPYYKGASLTIFLLITLSLYTDTVWGCFFNDLPLDYTITITVHRHYKGVRGLFFEPWAEAVEEKALPQFPSFHKSLWAAWSTGGSSSLQLLWKCTQKVIHFEATANSFESKPALCMGD